MSQATTVTTTIQWSVPQAITLGLGDVLLIPKQQAFPGLYSVRIGEASGTTWVYIGETSNLANRMQQYAKPGPPNAPTTRLAKRVRDTLLEAGTVAIATATTITIEVDGQEAGVDLIRPADRRLAENAALVSARFEGADQILTLGDGE